MKNKIGVKLRNFDWELSEENDRENIWNWCFELECISIYIYISKLPTVTTTDICACGAGAFLRKYSSVNQANQKLPHTLSPT